MQLRDLRGKSADVALLAALFLSVGAAFAGEPPALPRRDSVPRLLRTIPFGEYGSPVVRFGDLNGDGQLEALVVQEDASGGQNQIVVTCLTAIDLEGKVLWQVGKPDRRHIWAGGDTPIQIHDIDGDGQAEVIYQDPNSLLTILDGKTGKQKKQVQLAGGHDCLLFADLTGSGRAGQMVVKDRYSNFWVYDPARDFKLLWSKAQVITGHYPINFDFNGDGKDELLVGYRLYSQDGKILWSHDEFPSNREGHNDAVDVKDMDGDGRAEIALATSVDAVLLDSDGKILFRKPMHHTQHAMIGRFRPDLPGRQAFFVSREEGSPGVAPKALEAIYTKSGELLWDNTKQKDADKDGILTQAVVVENWTGNPNENFLALNRRGNAPPALLDGWGREIAVLPIPPRPEQPAGGRGPRQRYTDYYVKHIDCYGDEREEILVYDENALYIFTNAAFREKPEWYNDTIYNGRK